MKLYLFAWLCFISSTSFSMYLGKPLTQEELDQISRVDERRSPDFLKFDVVLKDGQKIAYSENLRGENAGGATCDISESSSSLKKYNTEPYYWHTLILAKLASSKGTL